MFKRRVFGLTIWLAVSAALMSLVGCSSSKPYTLVADLPSSSSGQIVAATIDVSGGACSVRIMLVKSPRAWMPSCEVSKDQSGFKSFVINGTKVDFGAVANGFNVLGSTLPTIPVPSASTVAAPAAATASKPKSATTAASSDSASGGTTAVSAPAFPTQWSSTPYIGTITLQGQNVGFLITSVKLDIHGSQGILAVTFKASYSPLKLDCTVVTNAHGDFTLYFNPPLITRATGGGNPTVQLVSEGTGITGNIWDSHGFDTWTPSLPPQWVATSASSN